MYEKAISRKQGNAQGKGRDDFICGSTKLVDLASNGYDLSSHSGKCGPCHLDLASNDHDLPSHGGEGGPRCLDLVVVLEGGRGCN